MANAPVLSHCSLLINPGPQRPVCWSIVGKEKPTFGSPFGGGGAFLSYRIRKASNDVNVYFLLTVLKEFPSCRNSYKLYQRIPGTL
jgi:hypothetical protein